MLAHVVKVTADTSFDDSIGSFAALTVGLQVEVSDTPDSTGAIAATRVEPRRAGETHGEGEHVSGDFRREVEGLVTRFVSATDFDIDSM